MTKNKSNTPSPALRERAGTIYQLLLDMYGIPEWRNPLPPMDELVSTILSQNTNDRNRDLAFDNLRMVLPTWEEVRDAPESDVIEAIRIAGLANQKGPRIQRILRQITSERGELSLDFLQEYSSKDAYEWLVRFNGVGPKTAAIVLLFSLNKPAFPVDTHIHRVTGRLGLRPPKMNREKAHEHLAAMFPPETYGPAHLNIIRLGREICHARKPNCPSCPLNQICDYPQEINKTNA